MLRQQQGSKGVCFTDCILLKLPLSSSEQSYFKPSDKSVIPSPKSLCCHSGSMSDSIYCMLEKLLEQWVCAGLDFPLCSSSCWYMQKKWASLGGMYSIKHAAVVQSFLRLSSDTSVLLFIFFAAASVLSNCFSHHWYRTCHWSVTLWSRPWCGPVTGKRTVSLCLSVT